MNKLKIINDPVYGFINLPFEIIFDIIEHPWFQRLRRIQQLGFTNLVYPGANHTRFHHALGAMHLMGQAINVLKSKGIDISDKEAVGVTIAILLHDVGHGPFSHALEKSIVKNTDHEELSLLFMKELNEQFNGKLSLAIEIFKNEYSKKFLHQLVSSQLDMDRLDYLTRDSFFTGVYEGVVGYNRIIKMLNVNNDQLVVEAKGIYSIEKFLIARRLMYWQVYLHKTVLVSELMLIKVLHRAKQLVLDGNKIFTTAPLDYFLNDKQGDKKDIELLNQFSKLDDNDIYTCLKEWQEEDDNILSSLSKRLINRNLLKIKLQNEAFDQSEIDMLKLKVKAKFKVSGENIDYLVFSNTTTNRAYNIQADNINILFKNGEVKDVAKASDHLNISKLSNAVVKHYLCYPNID